MEGATCIHMHNCVLLYSVMYYPNYLIQLLFFNAISSFIHLLFSRLDVNVIAVAVLPISTPLLQYLRQIISLRILEYAEAAQHFLASQCKRGPASYGAALHGEVALLCHLMVRSLSTWQAKCSHCMLVFCALLLRQISFICGTQSSQPSSCFHFCSL
jgi:hypothetical protein